MTEVTIGGNDYSIGTFSGEQQGQIIRRLAPHLTAMPKLLEKYRRQAVEAPVAAALLDGRRC